MHEPRLTQTLYVAEEDFELFISLASQTSQGLDCTSHPVAGKMAQWLGALAAPAEFPAPISVS